MGREMGRYRIQIELDDLLCHKTKIDSHVRVLYARIDVINDKAKQMGLKPRPGVTINVISVNTQKSG